MGTSVSPSPKSEDERSGGGIEVWATISKLARRDLSRLADTWVKSGRSSGSVDHSRALYSVGAQLELLHCVLGVRYAM
jgi:hypothetical protein